MSAALETIRTDVSGDVFQSSLIGSSAEILVRFLSRLDWQVVFVVASMSLVTTVAAYDVYWSFKTVTVLPETELNPLGCWLIHLDNGDIALFMTCKMLGTMASLLMVPAMFAYRRWWGMLAAGCLACGQISLFLFLCFA